MPKFKLLIRQTPGDTATSHEFIINGKNYVVPFDKEVVVPACVVEDLEHATEPYPVVVREEGKQAWTEVRQRSRFMYTAVPIDGEKPESVPVVDESPKRGRPKKEVSV